MGELLKIEQSCVYLDCILKNAYEIEEHLGDRRETVKLVDNISFFVEKVRAINQSLRESNWELTEKIEEYEKKIKSKLEEV